MNPPQLLNTLKTSLSSMATMLAIGLLWCIGQLPLKALLKLGEWIGIVMYHLMRRRTHITRCNIQACFPELSSTTQEALTKECIIENVRGLFESAKGWWGNTQTILDQVELHGIEVLQKAAASGKGCLLIGAHFSTLDLAGRIISEIWPLTILYRPFNNPIFNEKVLAARKRAHPYVIDKNRMRDLVRNIQKGGTLWYPSDQDYGPKDSVFAPFFNMQAATLATTAGLAKLCKGHVVGLYHHRMPDNRYRVEFVAMDNFEFDTPEKAATRANQMIESGIRLYPSQYMWVHRRFKTRPEGSSDLYETS